MSGDVASIQASGAQVELGINDAQLQAGVERAKAEILSLAKAIKTAQDQMRSASKAGNVEEATGAKLMIDGLKARQREVRRTFVNMASGRTEEEGITLRGAGRGLRGLSHMAALGGEHIPIIGHVGSAAMGAEHLMHGLGLSGVAGGVAAGGLAIGLAAVTYAYSHHKEMVAEASRKMIELSTASDQLGKSMREYRSTEHGEARAKLAEDKYREARAELDKRSAEVQANNSWDWDTPSKKEMADLADLRTNMNKWGEIARKEREAGSMELVPGEAHLGGQGAQYMNGYSITVSLLGQIEANTRGGLP
jgi:hypothetical protein